MSLQVWLPLNGDLTQQGLSEVEATNNGATVNNEGKIGKCYQFGTGTSYINLPPESMTSFTEASLSFWVKLLSWNASYATLFQAGTNAYAWKDYIFGVLRNGTDSTLCFTIGNGTNSSTTTCQTSALELNTWYHLTFTYNLDGYYRIYINGELNKESHTDTIIPAFSKITMIILGRANGNAYQSNCLMNDVRIYDHCLSQKEIKELSKGLLLHYKLDSRVGGVTNLLINGFGELGTENWATPNNVFPSEIPSNNSNIKASFKQTSSLEYIPLYRNHIYKVSFYIKAANTSGTTYPSILLYDIDKNSIEYYQERDGFNLSTMTTLTQELKTGDTKIYVADLSNWNANSGHYYNFAAIFDYVDSTGYKYPIGTYTRITPAFGSSTNAKTNLDKTNNIINLNTAYSGKTIPVGTSICASSAGGTYFYPLGGIDLTTVQDWTFKEGTFSSEHNRLKYAHYMRFFAYPSAYYAGITLTDETNKVSDNVIYDNSGYNNNGTIIDFLSKSYDILKYSSCINFNGITSGILIQNFNLGSVINDEITYSFWIKPNNENGARSVYFSSYNSTSWSLEKTTANQLRLWWNGSPDNKTSNMTISDNVWQHLVVTKKGTNDIKVYLNGELKQSFTNTHNNLNFPTTFRIGRDTRSNDGTPYKGLMSDFRIYTTALSAEDILELYHTAASIDNQGNLFCGEVVE